MATDNFDIKISTAGLWSMNRYFQELREKKDITSFIRFNS